MVIRLSYSILSAWARGDTERALQMYFREETPTTPAMELGKKMHDKWEKEINKTGKMPEVFGGKKLESHATELRTKRERMLNDWLQLVGVLDLLEGSIGRDWKCGKTSASDYSNGFQHKVYQILYPAMKKFEYHAYNPYTKEATMAIVHLSDKSLEDGLNWVMTYATDFRNHLEINNLMPKEK